MYREYFGVKELDALIDSVVSRDEVVAAYEDLKVFNDGNIAYGQLFIFVNDSIDKVEFMNDTCVELQKYFDEHSFDVASIVILRFEDSSEIFTSSSCEKDGCRRLK